MLELPITIRQPRLDEVPNDKDIIDLMEKRKSANIVEGFKFFPNTTHELPFDFYSLININNSRLWNLFLSLSKILPDNISAIYNLYEEEPIYSPYLKKEDVLNALALYKYELTLDGFIEFGVIFNVKDKLEEIFVTEAKYIKFWGVNESSFRQIMNEFNLAEIPDISFIDEFPKVVEALTEKDQNAKRPEVIIDELNSLFHPKKERSWKFWK